MVDKQFYEAAKTEFEINRDESTWIKSIAEQNGDEEKAYYAYLRYRAEELASERVQRVDMNTADVEDLKLFHRGLHVGFRSAFSKEIGQGFCDHVKGKNYSDVLCSIYVDKNWILITPTAKERSGLALAGALLGGGGGLFGAIGMEAGKIIDRKLEDRESRNRNQSLPESEAVVLIESKSAEVKAKEAFIDTDYSGYCWVTTIMVTGNGHYRGKLETMSIFFSFVGRSSKGTLFSKRLMELDKFCNLIGKPIPSVQSKKDATF